MKQPTYKELLQQAKKYLSTGDDKGHYRTDFICWALEFVLDDYRDKTNLTDDFLNKLENKADALKRKIESKLGYYKTINMSGQQVEYDVFTVSEYLEHTVKVPVDQLTKKNVQEFRHRWLDHLIEKGI